MVCLENAVNVKDLVKYICILLYTILLCDGYTISKRIAPSFFLIYKYMVYRCFRHDYYSAVPYNSLKRCSVHYLI